MNRHKNWRHDTVVSARRDTVTRGSHEIPPPGQLLAVGRSQAAPQRRRQMLVCVFFVRTLRLDLQPRRADESRVTPTNCLTIDCEWLRDGFSLRVVKAVGVNGQIQTFLRILARAENPENSSCLFCNSPAHIWVA